MSNTLVIFGATGDLTSRKLIPSLYQLYRKKRLPADFNIVGVARSQLSTDDWRAKLTETTKKFTGADFQPELWNSFAKLLHYCPGDVDQPEAFAALAKYLESIEKAPATRVYYLALAPKFYMEMAMRLGESGMSDEKNGPRRIVIEKPFGTDLQSARELNDALHKHFSEAQVYRIDHYLGKETVQNILVLRFANTIFEPLWNRNYISDVQITCAEEVLVGRRGGYYDTAGVMRDIFQNHLLQLLTITAMEVPARFEADLVRNEKVKVLQSIRPMTSDDVITNTLRGQYDGYRDEQDVPQDSQTATFAAIKLYVDNWRWQGVPFYLRSGKGMTCRTTQIVVQFREPPHLVFNSGKHRKPEANRLVINIQPAEGIELHFQTKVPDAGMKLRFTDLKFSFDAEFHGAMPEAYERLLLDTFSGDASLFARSDEVELAWGIIDPILKTWQETCLPELAFYEPRGWGPIESQKWMWAEGREWLDVCPAVK